MPWAVLVRAANVGGRVFRPSELVARLRPLELVSLGAAGTFAARAGSDEGTVRRAIAGALPFTAEIIVVSAARWHAYVAAHASDPTPAGKGVRRYVTVAATPIRRPPDLPWSFPNATGWGVTITDVDGPFVTGASRRLDPRMIYPNAVVEKEFGVAATTRWWETVVALDAALAEDPTAAAVPSAASARRRSTRASRAERGPAARRAG